MTVAFLLLGPLVAEQGRVEEPAEVLGAPGVEAIRGPRGRVE